MGVEPSRLSFSRSIRLVARKEHTPLRISDANSFLEDLIRRGSRPAPGARRLVGLTTCGLDVAAGPHARSVVTGGLVVRAGLDGSDASLAAAVVGAPCRR